MKEYEVEIVIRVPIEIAIGLCAMDLLLYPPVFTAFSQLFYPSQVFPNYPFSEPLSYRAFPNCPLLDSLLP